MIFQHIFYDKSILDYYGFNTDENYVLMDEGGGYRKMGIKHKMLEMVSSFQN
jgi:hypothetical protein